MMSFLLAVLFGFIVFVTILLWGKLDDLEQGVTHLEREGDGPCQKKGDES